jgi:SAM-dependent methyltransferase
MAHYYESEEFYQKISLTGSQNSLLSKVMHKFIEKDFDEIDNFPRVLEIGSDQGQHRSFVRHQYEEYVECDLHLPKNQTLDTRVRNCIGDIRALPFEENQFDRVIVTCVLHHLENPTVALNEIVRVTKMGGHISILIPREPSILYFTVRNFLMYVKHKNLGTVLKFHKIHKLQHIGNKSTIIESIGAKSNISIKKVRRLPWFTPAILYCYVSTKMEANG